jgi:arsenite-transporting ATPase
MTPITLPIETQKLIMIGGKGGVGKTTTAAAIALRFATRGERILILSSDPAPSLSDIFETPLADVPTPMPEVPELFGMEISSQEVLKRWKDRFGPEIYEVVSSFARVDYDFVEYIGSAPGIEEEYLLNFIMDLVQSGVYDRVIWDTAPAGHTLRLLHLPGVFLDHLEAATKFYMNLYSTFDKLKASVKLQTGKKTLLQIIEGWRELSREVIHFIHNSEIVANFIVTIPEALGVKQTERILNEFDENLLHVNALIVNYVIRNADCDFHRRRQAMQKGYWELLKNNYTPRFPVIATPLSANEIKGIDGIRQFGNTLFETGSIW